MDIKKYLSQTVRLDQLIDCKISELGKLRNLAMKMNANFTPDKIMGGKEEVSRMESILVKVIDLEREVDADIDRLVDLKKSILDTIDKINDPDQQLILRMRYVRGERWDDIAQALRVNKRWVFRLHERALKEFEKNLQEAT